MCNNPIVSIIDDDESVRVATSSLVRSLGWKARLYASAEQFMASGDLGDVTCIISDVRMPGISGIDMYRKLVGRGMLTPIIFISAFASDNTRRQAFDAGAVEHFVRACDELRLPPAQHMREQNTRFERRQWRGAQERGWRAGSGRRGGAVAIGWVLGGH